MECLLSLIEINQYQQYVAKQMKLENENQDIQIEFEVDFPSNIPTSIIIETDDKIDTLQRNSELIIKSKAFKLYQKYIARDSAFEINVSGLMRDQLIDFLDNQRELNRMEMTMEQLLCVFDEVKGEMYHLLSISLNRFSDDRDYIQIVNLLQKSKIIGHTTLAVTHSTDLEIPLS